MATATAYLVGGPARVGKSTLASRVQARLCISVLRTDPLVYMLDQAAPEVGVRWPPVPATVTAMQRFLVPLFRYQSLSAESFVLEGNAVVPEAVQELTAALGPAYAVRSCFLVNERATTEQLTTAGYLRDEPADVQAWFTQRVRERSREVRMSCDRLGLRCFDVGSGWDEALRQGEAFLLG